MPGSLVQTSVKRLGLLVVSVLLLGGACADEAGVGGPPEPGPDDPVSGSPSVSPTPGGPLVVTPREDLVDVRPRPWEEAEPVFPRILQVTFWSGPEACYGLDRVEVDEDQETVTVTLYEGRDPRAEVCIEIAVRKAVAVALEEPLGDRRVVDGST